MVVVAGARERRLAGMRSAVSWLGFFYLVATAIACMMLLMLNVPSIDFWKTFYFWRFFLTPLNVLFGGLILQLAASTCGCESRPSIIAIVVGIIHFVWCLVVIILTVDDLFFCAARPWCTVPPAIKIDPYFVIWIVGFFLAAVLELVVCIVASMLYRAARIGCPSVCDRRVAAAGGGFSQLDTEAQLGGPGGDVDSLGSEMDVKPVSYASTLGSGNEPKLFSEDMLSSLFAKQKSASVVAGFKQS